MRHIIPLYPAASLLAALAWGRFVRAGDRPTPRPKPTWP